MKKMKIGEFQSKDLTTAMANILDMASGENVVAFMVLCDIVREMDNRARNGDVAAQQITNVVRQFSKLIDLAKKSFVEEFRL